jgi:hypothetical protein
MTDIELAELKDIVRGAVAEAVAPLVAQIAALTDEEYLTDEEREEILMRINSDEPRISHEEVMRQAFGE